MNIIAWAYMVELENGLNKKQATKLLNEIPTNTEIYPFNLDEDGLLESNSMAHGFLDNDYYDELPDVQETLAEVCNNWENEREDGIYTTSKGYKVMLFCDSKQ